MRGWTFYKPKEDEPSVFSNLIGQVHSSWVDFGVRKLFDNLNGGRDDSDDVRDFLEHPAIKPDRDGRRTLKLNNKRATLSTAESAMLHAGRTIQDKIRIDLHKGLPPDLFEEPTAILTVDGLISLRWVLWTANMDNMTPEEAYVYALALTR